ncbi:PREDICTED: maestro heat-like repeat-containing protein family member 2B [Crocodylus porosus]|uniref:maestro heat-like repeat-containing protein family member 2B n=1 Tax=Crocodylus porosus TaxID=8502 RepID=UPI00093EFD32|nr:PREDICTED: maestro heat-like repeat-containing protein family member 2B [Crocodylus porosus]
MVDFMKKEPMDSLASPVCLRAMLAIKHLSKVKPSLNLDENRNILDDCLKCLLPLSAVKQLREEGETAQDSFQIQALHELSMKALGELMRGLLKEDPTKSWLMEMSHLLEPWFFSDKEWERDGALQASSQLLIAYWETIYCRSMTMDSVKKELRGLHEEPKASSPEAVLIASSHMLKEGALVLVIFPPGTGHLRHHFYPDSNNPGKVCERLPAGRRFHSYWLPSRDSNQQPP